MNRYLIFLIGIVGFLIVGIFFLSHTRYTNNRDTIIGQKVDFETRQLEEEFRGAYDEDSIPNGTIIDVEVVAAEGAVEIFDGVKTKVWSYNGTVPGPEIRIVLGDTLRLHFTNNLPEETTIHFHGIRVPNAMDGVPGVTQEPIAPGEEFTYAFTPKDAGTFWFHPHVRTAEQIERGLFGTIIVGDEVSQKYSQDKTLIIDDWRMTQDYQVDENFVTPMDLMHDGRWGNVLTVNGKLDEVLSAQPGERLRLRLVNPSNARIYALDFGMLQANAIAIDGMYVKKPFDANGFELAPGNRIDVDIVIPKDASGRQFVIEDRFRGNRNKIATIDVSGEVVATPTFDMPTNQNIPLWKDAHSAPIDKVYILDARRKPGSNGMGMMGGIEWTINGKAYPHYDPFTLAYNKFNKIRFQNNSGRLHPMHLHGQFFKVIARNGVPVSEEYFRDTVLVHPKEMVDIALVPLDKGSWVSHCHILEHADAGMLTVVEVK